MVHPANAYFFRVVSGSRCRSNIALSPPLGTRSVFPGNADRRGGLPSTGKDTMLLLHFKHFYPWFVANSEARCRADAQRSQDKNADALY